MMNPNVRLWDRVSLHPWLPAGGRADVCASSPTAQHLTVCPRCLSVTVDAIGGHRLICQHCGTGLRWARAGTGEA
jgi:hypothetical protein